MEHAFTSFMLILTAHFVGDFIFQTDRQAKGKSTSVDILAEHILTYSIPISLVGFFLLPMNFALLWVMINAGLHFITDFFTSKLNSYLWKQGRTHDFFVSVGFDQLIHYFCLIGTFTILTK